MANTLKFGNGTWATKEGSLLAYNSENNNYKPLPFTFDRASSATRVNKDGLIETVGADQPRIDYLNDSNGALLLEPSRSNLAIQSSIQNMSGSSSNSGVVEFGNLNNGLVSADITVNGQRQWYFSTANIVAGTEYTVSFYVDSFDLSSSNRPIFYIPTEGTNGVASIYGADIVLGRNQKTFTATANGSQFRIGLGTSSNDTGSIKLGGLQIEQGSYPTSYIPTQGSAVTRLVENITQTTPNLSNSQDVTFFIDLDERPTTGQNTTSNNIRLDFGTGNTRIIYNKNTSDQHRIELNIGGVASYYTMDIFVTTRAKIGVSLTPTTLVIYSNGLEKYSVSISNADWSNLLAIETNINEPVGNIKINDLRFYNTALTDSELQALTTI